MLITEFANSRNPSFELLTDEKRIFKTTKQQPQLHGYGSLNITEAVKAYGGRAMFNYTKSDFDATLVIPMSQK